MTPFIKRIIRATLCVVLTPLIFFLLFLVVEDLLLPADQQALFAAWMVTASLLYLAWIWNWWHQIRWTSARVRQTWIAAAASLLISLAVMSLLVLLTATTGFGEDEISVLVGAGVWLLLWLWLSTEAWTESPTERTARLFGRHQDGPEDPGMKPAENAITCPRCRYHLSGLREARCPECGATFTLEELFSYWVEGD